MQPPRGFCFHSSGLAWQPADDGSCRPRRSFAGQASKWIPGEQLRSVIRCATLSRLSDTGQASDRRKSKIPTNLKMDPRWAVSPRP